MHNETDTECEFDEIIPLPPEEAQDPSKTGPKGKKLVAVEVYGYEVGRGMRRRVVVPEDIYALAEIGCNDREIASWWGIDEQTLRYNFKDIMEKARSSLKHSLRRAMIKNALGGNAVMQIWLSKNWLGMSDNPNNTEANEPLPWSDDDRTGS